MAFKLTPDNTDDGKPVSGLRQELIGKFFGDPEYIAHELYQQRLQVIPSHRQKVKQKLMKLIDKILLRKRSFIETAND